MVFVGIDWAEAHNDVLVMDAAGAVLAHRPLAGLSDEAGAIKVLARAHQAFVWTRQRQVNALRSGLRDYFPAALVAFGDDLAASDALAVLQIAPTPERARALSRAKIASALRRGGRQRNVERRAAEIQRVLRGEHPAAAPVLADAFGAATQARVAVIAPLVQQIAELEARLGEHFDRHPDAEILRSLPGLGLVLGARVLGEFGDDPTRFADARGRKAYAGTAPLTRASGRSRVVLARVARNKRLADACEWWAFCSLTCSPGARRYYDALRARGKTNHQALRQLANRWVGLLHHCLEARAVYREALAWPEPAGELRLVA